LVLGVTGGWKMDTGRWKERREVAGLGMREFWKEAPDPMLRRYAVPERLASACVRRDTKYIWKHRTLGKLPAAAMLNQVWIRTA